MKDIDLIYKLNKEWQSGIKVQKAGGQTNRNWIVEHKKEKFFVRLPWERTDIVNRKVEGKNILALTRCRKLRSVVPNFFLYILNKRNILNPKEKYDFPDGTMIMEYIEGKDINGKDLENPKTQRALVRALHSFHTSGVKFVNTYDVFRDEVSKYRRKAKKYPVNRLLAEEKIKKIEYIEKKAKEKLPLGGKLSTHNDLIFENLRISQDGKIYILDFEYAGFNIRNGLHYDLGIILGGNLFYSRSIEFRIFEEFLNKAKKKYKRKLDDKKIYCGALTNVLVMFWWGIVKYFSSKTQAEKKYFKAYILKRAKGIEELFAIINGSGS